MPLLDHIAIDPEVDHAILTASYAE